MNDFQFNFRHLYTNEIENNLYTVDTRGLDIPYHTVQQVDENYARCLICTQNFPLPIENDTILKHFQENSSHNDQDFLEAKDTYVKVFMSMRSFYKQLAQLFFKPLTPFIVFCEICNKKVEIYRVDTHMKMESHYNKQVKKVAHLDWPSLKVEILKLKDIYREAYGSISHLLKTDFKDSFHCFACQSHISQTTDIAHFTKKHQSRTGALKLNSDTLEKVSNYNIFFETCDERIKAFKKYFVPGKTTSFYCILCKEDFDSFTLILHASEFPCVFLQEDHALYDKSVDFDSFRKAFLQTLPFCNYDEDVNLRLYPKQAMEEVYNIEGIPPFTVQKRNDSWWCLLCNCLMNEDSFEEHLNSKVHVQHSSERCKLLELVSYHKFWMAHTPEDQYCQSIFSPLKNELRCYLCKNSFSSKTAIKHFKHHNKKEPSVERCMQDTSSGSSTPKSTEKSSQVSGRGTPQIPTPRSNQMVQNAFASEVVNALINKGDGVSTPRSNESENQNEESFDEDEDDGTSYDEDDFYPSTSKAATDNLENTASSSSYNVKEDFGTDAEDFDKDSIDSINIKDLQISNGNEVQQNNIKPKGTELPEYCETIEDELYSNFNRERGERRPTILFIQKRYSNYFCLFCNSFVGRVIAHLQTKKHLKNSKNQDFIKSVQAYHKYFMNQHPDVQLNQITYNPCTENAVLCILCNNNLLFKTVISHSCPLRRLFLEEKFIKKYSGILEKYNEFSIKKFFGKSFMDLSQLICRFDMPLGLQWGRTVICYLCGKEIRHENNDLWISHLTKHAAVIVNNKLMDKVKAFHQFWIKQPQANQIRLVNFRPKNAMSFVCINNEFHIINSDKVFEHCSKCTVEGFDNLIRILHLHNQNINEASSSVDYNQTPSTSRQLSIDDSSESAEPQPPAPTKIILPFKFPTPFNNSEIVDRSNLVSAISELNLVNPTAEEHEKLIFPSINKLTNGHLIDKIPNRFKNQLQFLEKTAGYVNCLECNLGLKDETVLISHISTKKHLAKTKSETTRWLYHCEPCVYQGSTEDLWQIHLGTSAHLTRITNLPPSRKPTTQEYECSRCKMVLFGDKLSILRHLQTVKPKNDNRRNGNVTYKKINLPKGVKTLFPSSAITQKKAEDLADESDCAYEDNTALNICIAALERVLSKLYPGTQGYHFGSRYAALGNKKSDLDIFMDIGNMYLGAQKQMTHDQQQIVIKVSEILHAEEEFEQIYPIVRARTPIIRVVHIPTSIDCDLSFRNGLSVENTKFITFCFDVQPSTRLGMLILRAWADQVKLKEEITSYALCMMFIFHLQLQGYLLSVKKLRELSGLDVPNIDGWEIINYENITEDLIHTHVTLFSGEVHEILREFFNFYSKFDFSQEVVCPLLGQSILKRKFEEKKNGQALPSEMNSYKLKLQADQDVQFRTNCPMCVQDPFDLGHNLTKSVPRKFKDYFKQICLFTYEHLRDNP